MEKNNPKIERRCKNEMENIEVEKKINLWRDKCPYCEKVIEGTSESQVRFNLKIHISAKHPSENENDKKQ